MFRVPVRYRFRRFRFLRRRPLILSSICSATLTSPARVLVIVAHIPT